jgi:hypothetical protein
VLHAQLHGERLKEHLRSQLEDTGGKPELTPKEVELVRFIRESSTDWANALKRS